jgi:hypothetical protein
MLAELPHLGQIIPVQIQGRLVEEIDKMRARDTINQVVNNRMFKTKRREKLT